MKIEELRLRILFIILVGVVCYGVSLNLHFGPWIPALVGGWVATLIVVAERGLNQTSVRVIIIGAFGLALGVILANLIAYPLLLIAPLKSFAPYILLLTNLIFATVGVTVATKRETEIYNFLFRPSGKGAGASQGARKVLDTSVIIDGRILDLCKTGFIEGTLIIPNFVLTEIGQIADSSSSTKRARGRRGLDMVNKLQTQENVPVEIVDKDFPEIKEVDTKLLRLGKLMQATVLTNDYNLRKLAKIQDVQVLNINELATSLKPILLPGESLRINVIKEGENPDQGVAYLEDGTMVVVERGKKRIGQQTEVTVTSVLQTTTGKMIFTEVKEEPRTKRPRVRKIAG
ncbi:TRAM domain-containing protein [Candidatus Aerophobetes bacterium]|uniref:TRAM domain-containing protein n=1 Tax=Aerophobetes bacterium TaxID=2030807 RepID=A0A523W374_UNCAE|nr:MAG: TRAM domain-containing protein [Candidatus Aerophobetes bacterium]